MTNMITPSEFVVCSAIIKDLEDTKIFTKEGAPSRYLVSFDLLLRSKPFQADSKSVSYQRHTGYSLDYEGKNVDIYKYDVMEEATVPPGINYYDKVVAYLDDEKVAERTPKIVVISSYNKSLGDGDYEKREQSVVEYRFRLTSHRFDSIPEKKTIVKPVKLRLDLYHGEICTSSITKIIANKAPFLAKDYLTFNLNSEIKSWEKGEDPPNREFTINFK